MGRVKEVASAVGAAAALALGAPAMAHQPPQEAPTEADIVVVGERERDVARQIDAFVGALTRTRANGQIARFEFAACPAALGFAPTQRPAIERRLRTVAGAAGLPVRGADCSVNMLVIAAPDKRAFIQAMRRRHPDLFGEMSPPAYRRLLAESGPAAAWHVEAPVSPDGRQLDTGLTADGDAGVVINRTFGLGGMTATPARRAFHAAVVVIETQAMVGLTPTQLADYAAMRLLARTDPSRLPAPAPDTILTALTAPAGAAVPLTLTHWDLGFLRGLYGSAADAYATEQRRTIAREVGRQVERGD
jgi:hypothetical protein